MAETQAYHRQTIEMGMLNNDSHVQKWGQFFGFFLATLIVIGSMALLFFDKNIAGLSTILTTVISVSGAYVYTKRKEPNNKQRNSNEL